MGSLERSKKKVHLWKKAVVHFALCFVMGFFTGFAPTNKTPSRLSSSSSTATTTTTTSSSFILSNTSSATPTQIASLHSTSGSSKINRTRSLISEQQQQQQQQQPGKEAPFPTTSSSAFEDVKTEETIGTAELGGSKLGLTPRRLIIIITPTNARDPHQGVHLRRLANTLRLVPPPVLWVVVEHMEWSSEKKEEEVSEMLRSTGMMYRHLEYRENFTTWEVELEHQRNLALMHLERHRLSGIVHFAGIHNVYDLDFFNELREIEMFGTWPMATLTPHKSEVVIEGPVCDSSQIIGWHLMNKMKDTTPKEEEDPSKPPINIHVSSFAFNSSILWDPERWGRPSSSQRTSQNSIKFVKEAALEGETKLKGIPAEECSKIMVWRLRLPTTPKK